MKKRPGASFQGLKPASVIASKSARAASKKKDTRCEIALRKALWRLGLRYRLHAEGLPGRPDVVFVRERLAVFCDGDFWHGRNLEQRLGKLADGHNASYWLKKIRGNVERDARNAATLELNGWRVLRLWETDIIRDPMSAADLVASALRRTET